ncbi:hypothetical protein V8E36_001675 [Tilletia maclaganii]
MKFPMQPRRFQGINDQPWALCPLYVADELCRRSPLSLSLLLSLLRLLPPLPTSSSTHCPHLLDLVFPVLTRSTIMHIRFSTLFAFLTAVTTIAALHAHSNFKQEGKGDPAAEKRLISDLKTAQLSTEQVKREPIVGLGHFTHDYEPEHDSVSLKRLINDQKTSQSSKQIKREGGATRFKQENEGTSVTRKVTHFKQEEDAESVAHKRLINDQKTSQSSKQIKRATVSAATRAQVVREI